MVNYVQHAYGFTLQWSINLSLSSGSRSILSLDGELRARQDEDAEEAHLNDRTRQVGKCYFRDMNHPLAPFSLFPFLAYRVKLLLATLARPL